MFLLPIDENPTLYLDVIIVITAFLNLFFCFSSKIIINNPAAHKIISLEVRGDVDDYVRTTAVMKKWIVETLGDF